MVSARFLLNGTNNGAVPATLSPDSGSGYRLIADGSTIKYSTAQAYQGTASMKGDGGQHTFFDDGAGNYIGDSAMYLDFFVYVASYPGSDTFLVGSVYDEFPGAHLGSSGQVKLKNAAGTTLATSSNGFIQAAAWNRVRVEFTTQSVQQVFSWGSNTGSFGTDDPSLAGAASVTYSGGVGFEGFLALGTAYSGFYFDDVVIQPVADGNPSHPAVGGGGTVRKGWGVIR